jgi:hypothetical protein
MRLFVLTLSFCVACFVLVACGGSGTENTANTANTAPSNTKAANTATANSSTTATNTSTTTETASTKIGVPECDDYLDKYEACVTGKIPAAARATYQSTLETTRKSWRDLAATPTGKAGLATACKAATDAAKQAMSSFGCSF